MRSGIRDTAVASSRRPGVDRLCGQREAVVRTCHDDEALRAGMANPSDLGLEKGDHPLRGRRGGVRTCGTGRLPACAPQRRAADRARFRDAARAVRRRADALLLDELSVYLREVEDIGGAADQLTAFLTSLFKAVESAPNAALVYTLAIGRDGRAVDAYSEENQFIADRVVEAESVSARKATLLNPTRADEYLWRPVLLFLRCLGADPLDKVEG